MRTLLLIVLSLIASVVGGDEEYRMEVYYGVTDETVCAHFKFDNFNSCTAAKVWFAEQAAWHGKNKYRCIPLSQCPIGTK